MAWKSVPQQGKGQRRGAAHSNLSIMLAAIDPSGHQGQMRLTVCDVIW